MSETTWQVMKERKLRNALTPRQRLIFDALRAAGVDARSAYRIALWR
jgi:hypothetical protein